MQWFLFGILLSFATPTFAGINHSSDLQWQSQESAHFRVHFYAGEADLAKETLNIAEAVYQRLTPIFDWYPVAKTEIVLSDEMDASNGFAMPIPSNRMTLFVSRPNDVNSLEDHAGWLKTLILHEFVHTLHLDKARHGPKNIRHVFGRVLLAFPNMYMPPWMHEGLATYYETDQALGIGRGQSSYFQMMMRMEVANGIKPLRQVNQLLVTWPMLTSRYLYGVYFEQFIADTYGVDTLQKIVNSYSDHWLPFAINTVYADVLGKDLSQLWVEFEAYLQQKFVPQIQHIQNSGITSMQSLTQNGDFKRSLLQTDDGRIFYMSDNLASGAKLVQQYQGKTTVLLQLNIGAKLDWHEQAGLLMVQPDTCDNANRYYDIYRVDEHGSSQQLTQCARYIDATWSPDGTRIVAIKNYRGQHAIHILDAHGALLKVLWQGKDNETLSGLDWSDDGKLLVSSVWRKDTGWDIETFDLGRQSWSKVTDDMHIQTDARFVDGSHDIVFSADDDGVYNVYRLQGDTLIQLTDVLGGVFAPFLTRQNELLAVSYGAQGFDVVRFPQLLHKRKQHEDSAKAFNGTQFAVKPVTISEAVPYSAWDSAMPTSWLPSFLITNQGAELGAYVFGSDVLNRHNYTLYAGYQSVSASPVFNLDYIYDGWYPLLKLHANQLQTSSFDASNRLIALTEQQRLDAELIFPWLKQQSRWSAHWGVTHRRDALAWLGAGYAANFRSFQDTLAGVALSWDTRLVYPRGVSKTSTGSMISLLVESGRGLGGTYTGDVSKLAVRHFFDWGSEHVLGLRLDLGHADSHARPFALGGQTNNIVLPDVVNVVPAGAGFNQRSYALRGYADAAIWGQQMALFSAEYRFPLARIERGFMSPPIGIHQFFGQVFTDIGRASNSISTATTYASMGAEVGGDIILFYTLPVRMQLGYAKGLDDALGGSQIYFRLGSSF